MKLTPARSVLLLAFLSLLPFAPALNTQQALLSRDLSITFLPAKSFFWEVWHKEGRMPLWNPYVDAGTAYLSDLTASPLHPLNYFFLLFPRSMLPTAFSLWIAIQVMIASLGLFFFLRSIGRSNRSSLLLATAFAWSGPIISSHLVPHLLGGFAFGPWALWAVTRWTQSKNSFWTFPLSAFLCLSFLSGDPIQVYVTVALCFTYAWIHRPSPKAWLEFCGASGLFTFLLALPQILPVASAYFQSGRAIGSTETSLVWAFHPFRLLEWLVPHYFGSFREAVNFRHHEFTGSDFYWGFFLWDSHFGWMAFAGVLWSVVQEKFNFFRSHAFSISALMILLALSMGAWLPLNVWDLFSSVVPFWGSFRYPERLLPWVALFLCVIASSGWNSPLAKKPWLLLAIVLLGAQGYLVATRSILWTPTSILQPSLVAETKEKLDAASIFAANRIAVRNEQTPLGRVDPDSIQAVSREQWASLSGNTPSYFGLGKISGYLSLDNSEKSFLRNALEKKSVGLSEKLFGAGLALEKTSAQIVPVEGVPLIFSAQAWKLDDDRSPLADLLEGVLSQPSTVLLTKPLGVEIEKRDFFPRSIDSHGIEIEIAPGEKYSLIHWNMTFDPQWEMIVGETRIEPLHSNGWATAFLLPPSSTAEVARITYSRSNFHRTLLGPLVWLIFLLYFFWKHRLRSSATLHSLNSSH